METKFRETNISIEKVINILTLGRYDNNYGGI